MSAFLAPDPASSSLAVNERASISSRRDQVEHSKPEKVDGVELEQLPARLFDARVRVDDRIFKVIGSKR
jgi:hypothetical protein